MASMACGEGAGLVGCKGGWGWSEGGAALLGEPNPQAILRVRACNGAIRPRYGDGRRSRCFLAGRCRVRAVCASARARGRLLGGWAAR